MRLRFYRSFATELMKLATVDRFGMVAGAHDLKAKTKIDEPYQGARDYAVAAGKGALTGAAVVGLADKMSRKPFARAKHYRTAAGLGAGGMVVDRIYRHHQAKQQAGHEKNAMIDNKAGLGSFRTPAVSLANSRKTGKIQASAPRLGFRAPKAPSI